MEIFSILGTSALNLLLNEFKGGEINVESLSKGIFMIGVHKIDGVVNMSVFIKK